MTAELRTIAGIVDPNGKRYSGVGFHSEREGKGFYDITFEPEFKGTPAVVVTQAYHWPMKPNQSTGDTRDNAVVYYIDQHHFHVKLGDSGGEVDNRAFSFIAVGT